mgnify:CR=1 FL=1
MPHDLKRLAMSENTMIYMTISRGNDFGEVWIPERFHDKLAEALVVLQDVAVIQWKDTQKNVWK